MTTGRTMNYKFWSKENPNNYNANEHCAHIWGRNPDFKWNDNDCTDKLGFVCEIKPK